MLTKKEKLLTYPWIEKKYQNHRRKVQSAGAAIDFHPPSIHPHVNVKLKKTQREKERLIEIERENRRLLQRLGQIMNTSRLENYWREPRPNFLNREFINPRRPQSNLVLVKSTDTNNRSGNKLKNRCSTASVTTTTTLNSSIIIGSVDKTLSADLSNIKLQQKGSLARCPTCSGRPVQRNQIYPEERIPWEPPRISWNRKLRDLPPKRPQTCCVHCCQ